MFHLEFIEHKEIRGKQLDEIIKIKSVAWPYNHQQQLNWLNQNLKNTDIHALLSCNQSLVAYLNLIDIKFTADQKSVKGFGIGNVCALEKNRGYGKELITRVNSFIRVENKTGLLFCKDHLVDFYKKNGWELIDKKQLKLSFEAVAINTMQFNLKEGFQCIEYHDKPF